jgi:hypothetical protein
MAGDETTIRNLSTDLARLEGATEAKIEAIREDVAEVKGDVKDILKALQGHADQLAENRGRDRVATAGISLAIAAATTWLMKQLGHG